MWLTAVAGAAAALRLVLTDAPRPANTVELAAAGWSPRTLRASTGVLAAAAACVTFAAAAAAAGPRSGALAAVAVALWAPVACSPLVRSLVLAGSRARRDAALLEWLRRVRLYAAAGRPINDAALEAAERVQSRAFATVSASINLALAGGREPLAAAASHFAGSAAETLVGTLAEAERSGAAAADLIDRLVAQAVAALEDQRRVRYEALGRSVATTLTLASLIATGVVVTAMLAATRIRL